MARVDATAKSSIKMSGQEKIDNQISSIESSITALYAKENYWQSKINYSDSIIQMCDNIISHSGFHPIQKTKAMISKKLEEARKMDYESKADICRKKIKSLELKKANNEISKENQYRNIENKTLMIPSNKASLGFTRVEDGKVNLSDLANKDITRDLFDSAGNPTPNFEILKQLIVDYPQTITTLPESVVQQLNNQKLTARVKQATFELNGKTYDMTYDKDLTAFEYMCGMAAAGFDLAEKQGRTMQSNPNSRMAFADWKKEQLSNLTKAKTSAHTSTNANTYETQVFF